MLHVQSNDISLAGAQIDLTIEIEHDENIKKVDKLHVSISLNTAQ